MGLPKTFNAFEKLKLYTNVNVAFTFTWAVQYFNRTTTIREIGLLIKKSKCFLREFITSTVR